MVTQDAQPDEGEVVEAEVSDPQPVQIEPKVTEDLAPLKESEPSAMPKSKTPVTPVTPTEQPVVPELNVPNDLFETPPATDTSAVQPEPDPQPEMPAAEETTVEPEPDPLDSLFDPPASDPLPSAEEPAPAEETQKDDAEPAEEEDPLDDLFGEVGRPDVLSVPGGLRGSASRTWTDNTAKYHCEARLLGVEQGKIVLAQANGKISHVPLRRLSDRDLGFVYQQVVAQRDILARQAEAEQLASVWSE